MVKPVSLFEASSGKTFKTEFEAHKDDLIGSLTTACSNAATAVQMVDKLVNFEALHHMSEAIVGMMAHHPSAPTIAEPPCPVKDATMPEIRTDDPERATFVKNGESVASGDRMTGSMPEMSTADYKRGPMCGVAPPSVNPALDVTRTNY